MSIVVVMPAYNESEGIAEFQQELNGSLVPWNPAFVVVDDASSDGTAEAAGGAANSAAPIDVIVRPNPVNRGHGPSTLAALRLGLANGADAVVAIDGDGQFTGSDVAVVVKALLGGELEVAEGVRTARGDALYRRGTSLVTRMLVWSRSGSWPQEANTPLRAYRPAALEALLKQVPQEAMTPNLIISPLCRRNRMRIAQVPVVSRPRRGSTLNTRQNSYTTTADSTSRRFMSFCVKAAGQVGESMRAGTKSVPAIRLPLDIAPGVVTA